MIEEAPPIFTPHPVAMRKDLLWIMTPQLIRIGYGIALVSVLIIGINLATFFGWTTFGTPYEVQMVTAVFVGFLGLWGLRFSWTLRRIYRGLYGDNAAEVTEVAAEMHRQCS